MNSPKFLTMGHLKLYNFFELEQARQLKQKKCGLDSEQPRLIQYSRRLQNSARHTINFGREKIENCFLNWFVSL